MQSGYVLHILQDTPQATAGVCNQRDMGSVYAPVLLLCGLQTRTTRGKHLSITVTVAASAMLTPQYHIGSLLASYGSYQCRSCAKRVRQYPLLSAPSLPLLTAHTDLCACMAFANSACSCQVSQPVCTTMQSISFWIKHPSIQIADLPKVSKVGDDSLGETAVRLVSLTRPIVFLHGVGWGLVSFLMLFTMHAIACVNLRLGFVMSFTIQC